MKLWAIIPELILAGMCLAGVPLAGLIRKRMPMLPAILVGLGLLAAIATTARMLPWAPLPAFSGAYAIDGFASSFKLVIEIGALLSLLLLVARFRHHPALPHAPVALAFATLGAVGLVSSNDLGLIVLFLQMMSMAGYVLIALVRTEARALEAVLKYFVYAAVALAVMGYGLTFLYGLTGSLDLNDIGAALGGADRVWVATALIFILVGYGFEIAMVPVHVWAPDTFSGSTAAVAGFLSVVPKVAAMGALMRFLLQALPGELVAWPWIIAGAAALSMTTGNLVALRQTHLKRLLAWSSIAQAGYVLAGVVVAARSALPPTAVAFFLLAYAFANLGAFAVAGHLERSRGDDSIAGLRGLHRRNPGVAAVMLVAMLSLAGIPPLAGFAGKVVVLAPVIAGDMLWLAVLAAANMVIGLVYYLRVMATMYLQSAPAYMILPRSPAHTVAYVACTAGTVALGVIPELGLAVLDAAVHLL